jgi:hypothetical protein
MLTQRGFQHPIALLYYLFTFLYYLFTFLYYLIVFLLHPGAVTQSGSQQPPEFNRIVSVDSRGVRFRR